MSDFNYGSGFYLIEVSSNHYDLFNSITDNKILEAQPVEKIVSFLELNMPSHPFLYQVSEEDSWSSFSSTVDEPYNKYFKYLEPSDKDVYADWVTNKYRFNYNYDLPCDDEYYYSEFNYGMADDYFIVDEDGIKRNSGSYTQLEFDFTYKDTKGMNKTNPSKNSPNMEDEELPYLPDDTDE